MKARGVNFQTVMKAIKRGGLIKIIEHPNREKYPKQKIFLVKVKSYLYVVPFVEEENYIFLKTIIPSRKYTKIYLSKTKT